MKSISMSKEGYYGISGDKGALNEDDVKKWADTKDSSLIPLAIASLKGFQAAESVSSITCTPSSKTLAAGDKLTLTVARTPDYSAKTVTWASSAESYATVAADSVDPRIAVVTAVASGSATITATCDEKTATCSVTVS